MLFDSTHGLRRGLHFDAASRLTHASRMTAFSRQVLVSLPLHVKS
jgi:hypothetical protein